MVWSWIKKSGGFGTFEGFDPTMTTEGYVVTSELLRRLSPCMTRHLRRFGQYTLDMEARPDPLVLNPLQFTNNEKLK